MRYYYQKVSGMGYASVRLAFNAGKLYEPKQFSGISHLAEHMFFRQLGDIHIEKLYRMVNQMGATLHGLTDANFIAFDITVRTDFLLNTIELLLGALQTYDWLEKDFIIEKEVVLRQIIEGGDYSLNRRLNEKCYRGTMLEESEEYYESVEAIGIDDINEFKRSVLCSSNAALIIVGDFGDKEEEIQKIIEMHIDDERLALPSVKPYGFSKRTRSDDILVPGAEETCDVMLSFDCDTTIETWKVSYLLDVVGTGDGALLPWELKEKRGWIGDLDTVFNVHRDFGNIVLSYSVAGEHLLESLKIVFNVLNTSRNHLSETMINAVEPFYSNHQYPRMYSEDYVYKICTQGFLREEECDNDVLCKMASSITAKEIESHSKSIFSPANMTALVYYDNRIVKRKDIRAALDNYRMVLNNEQ